MPHYNAYDSFKTKKRVEKKRRAKEKLEYEHADVDSLIYELLKKLKFIILMT